MEYEGLNLPVPEQDVLLGITPELAKYDDLYNLHCEDGPAYVSGGGSGTKLYYWHGISVKPKVIEDPRRLTVQEILDEPNIAVRHFMIRKKGIGAFLKEANPVLLDADYEGGNPTRIDGGSAAGGHGRTERPNPRKLYKFDFPWIELIKGVSLPDDEPLVVLHVIDPAKKRRGLGADVFLRVPPNMETCEQAVAWTFGFEKAGDYQPLQEE